MKKPIFLKAAATILAVLMLFSLAACQKNNPQDADSQNQSSAPAGAAKTVGEGQTAFSFQVVDRDGNQSDFTVRTDEKAVGAALLKAGLIAGDQSSYGLYVKTVNGITLDFDTDGYYWAFYVNGQYGNTGVDSTNIDPTAVYSLKAQK